MATADVLDLLTGPGAGELLSAAVGTSGGELVAWSVQHVDHRSSSTTAAYRATVRHSNGRSTSTLAATTAAVDASHPGLVVLANADATVSVWCAPDDPRLPGLAVAMDGRAMATLLESFGIGSASEPDATRTRLVSYRPRRRAVVEVTTSVARVFVKVVAPDRIEGLHRRHDLMTRAGLPSPRSLGWHESGMILLAPLSGIPMRNALRDSGFRLPSIDQFVSVLDRIPDSVLELRRRPAWAESASHYADVIATALPAHGDRARQLAHAIEASLVTTGEAEPVHGDFYDAQVMLEGEQVTGLLDIDTLGPGRRVDDLACLIAHAAVLSTVRGLDERHLKEVAAGWARAVLDAPGDAHSDLPARCAGVLLSLATGPHRVQEKNWPESTRRRLDLVEDWLSGAWRGRDG